MSCQTAQNDGIVFDQGMVSMSGRLSSGKEALSEPRNVNDIC
jgi:hypothetical protein